MATPTDERPELLTVIASMTARPGKEDELRAALESLVEPTTREDGNVNYDLHVAVDDPATFFFYENWESRSQLEAHLAADHLAALLARTEELLVDGLHVTQLRRIG